MSDDWSSLDGSSSSDNHTSGSEDESSSDESILSIGEEQEEDYASSSESSSPSSTRPTTPGLTGAKRDRQSALDSLLKRRQSKRRVIEHVHEESIASSSSEDSESSSSSIGSEDLSFYLRINSKLDKVENHEKSIAEHMSGREAFLRCMQYYAVCFVSPDGVFRDGTIKSISPELIAGRKKTERAALARRDIIRPSYWKPDQMFVRAIERYPDLRIFRLPRHDSGERICHACNKMGYKHFAVFRGDPYDSNAVWRGDIAQWLRRGEKREYDSSNPSDSSDDSDEIDTSIASYIVGRIELGATCAQHAVAFHGLQHVKHYLLESVQMYIDERNLATADAKDIVKRIENEKNGKVEQWYQKYLTAMSDSEKDLMASNFVDEDNIVEHMGLERTEV
jgi:hypothetical protein